MSRALMSKIAGYQDGPPSLTSAILDTAFADSSSTLGTLMSGSTANALIINNVVPFTDLTGIGRVSFVAALAPTGACTVSVDSLSAVAVNRADGSAIQANDWAVGQLVHIDLKNGTFQLAMDGAIVAAITQRTFGTLAPVIALTRAQMAAVGSWHVVGYLSLFDGCGGDFAWNGSSTATADGKTIIAASDGGTGRAIKILKPGEPATPFFWCAKGDGTTTATDDTLAIQAALDSGRDVYIPGGFTFIISPQPSAGLPGQFGTSSVCLNLTHDYQRIYGGGILKLKAASSASSGAMIANLSGATLTGVTLSGFVLDGNKANTTGTISGAVICNGVDCTMDTLLSVNVTYIGLQFAIGSTNCSWINTRVEGSGYIGHQAQFPIGLSIAPGCKVRSSGDNAFDIYGNNGLMTGTISGCIVSALGLTGASCLVGLFLESGGNFTATGNEFDSCSFSGVYMNAINTGSLNNNLSGNKYSNRNSMSSMVGVFINNNSGSSIIQGEHFNGLLYSFQVNTAVSVQFGVCYHQSIVKSLFGVNPATNAMLVCNVAEQILSDTPSTTTGRPFTFSPYQNSLNHPDRIGSSRTAQAYSLTRPSALSSNTAEYTSATITLAQNSAWSNAYSFFTGGQTQVCGFGSAVPGAIPGYILINGTMYYLASSPSTGIYHIQNTSFADGNYVSATNSAYVSTVFFPDWMTA